MKTDEQRARFQRALKHVWRETRFNQRRAAAAIDMSWQHLNRIIHGSEATSYDTAVRIAEYLQRAFPNYDGGAQVWMAAQPLDTDKD